MLASLAAVCLAVSAPKLPSEPYRWKSVPIVGAGFVDGIVFHPTAKDVQYARTDMGGAYRWSARDRRWVPLLDWLSYADTNLMGVESIAVDPSDPRRVILACGTYTNADTPNGAVLRSRDQGRTFERTNVPVKFGGNENGRGNGERMMIDPNDGRVAFLGTRQAGLWTSTDSAATWSRVGSFPEVRSFGRAGAGIIAVVFDPRTGRKGQPSRTVYVAISQTADSLVRSTDGGATWAAIEGQPNGLVPTHMVLASDGHLFVTYGSSPGPSRMTDGAVWRLDTGTGRWTDVTPEPKIGYVGLSVQNNRPSTLIVSSFGRPNGEQIFRSLDSGATWRPVIGGRETFDASAAPYTARVGIHWLFDIEIDPANPDHALFTTGYGGHETFNLTDADRGKPVRWRIMSRGIEESVALSLASPPKGAHLITGIGDYGGSVHWDLDRPEPGGNFVNPHFGNTDGVAVAEQAPNVVVRVGRASGFDIRANIGYSTDFGRTSKPAEPPFTGAVNGAIAVSSDGKHWVWSLGYGPHATSDGGKTWVKSAGIRADAPVVAARRQPNRFYALGLFEGRFYRSDDGGTTFSASDLRLSGRLPVRGGNRGDARGGQDKLYVTPGRDGDLWIAAFDGLHHSTDDGATFRRVAGVQELHAFGFGRGAPGRSCPALFLVGTVEGQRGVFRSDDMARSWVRINDDAHQWGLVLHVAGDPKRFGRVYVGTHGRGTFYGDPTVG